MKSITYEFKPSKSRNLLGVRRTSAYLLLGLALWVVVLESGVHATLAGVLIAFCFPLREVAGHSPLKSVESDLHTPVAYFILPLFAFANAGLALGGMGLQDLTSPVALGIMGGLALGNPVGVLLFTGIGVALGFTRLPDGVNWFQMAGVSFICGVGFTMSLFIAGGAWYDVVRLGPRRSRGLPVTLAGFWLGFGEEGRVRQMS